MMEISLHSILLTKKCLKSIVVLSMFTSTEIDYLVANSGYCIVV